MTSGDSDVIEIIESDTELGANQRIGWSIHFAGNTVRLETINAGCCEFNIISPAGHNRISLDLSARDLGGRQALREA